MTRVAAIGCRGALLLVMAWGALALTGCGGVEGGATALIGGDSTGSRDAAAVDGPVGTVTGRVITAVGRYPGAGAKVSMAGREAVTGEAGDFRITEVPVGVHLLEVTANGYSLFWDYDPVEVSAGVTDVGDIEVLADSDIPGAVPPLPPGL